MVRTKSLNSIDGYVLFKYKPFRSNMTFFIVVNFVYIKSTFIDNI